MEIHLGTEQITSILRSMSICLRPLIQCFPNYIFPRCIRYSKDFSTRIFPQRTPFIISTDHTILSIINITSIQSKRTHMFWRCTFIVQSYGLTVIISFMICFYIITNQPEIFS